MRLSLEFMLILQSDWHINAGFGVDGKADAVIERDPQGKPIISGTTLKGIFRDALYDLALILQEKPNQLTDILGAPGCDSHWRFSVARTKSTKESMIATGVRVDPRFRRAEDNKYFKRELGAAAEFSFEVNGNVELTHKEISEAQKEQKSFDQAIEEKVQKEIEWLVAAAAYIDRLGGRRRRGNGKCIISLVDQHLHNEVLESFENRYCHGTHQLTDNWKTLIITDNDFEVVPYRTSSRRYRIVIYTERPIIIAEKPEAGNVYQGQIVIPGSTLRGAFAELARPGDLQVNDPMRYEEFKRLFISGELRFSHLNPLEVNDGVGIPVAQFPMGVQQDENSQDAFTSVFQGITKQKGFSGWGLLQDGFQKASYHTESHPHIRINPDLKRASDGDLYTYEAIPAGRYYAGELYLKDDDWQCIGELLRVNIGKPFELLIGKGRHRSYGQVKAIIVPIDEDEPPLWIHTSIEKRLEMTSADTLYITLATDTIVQDTWGRFYGRFEPDWLAHELKISNVQLADASAERSDQVVRTKVVESFDARSGLPRWRDKALIAGSTAQLVFANGQRPSIGELKRLETEGIGLRRGEGYGRVIFNHPMHTGQQSGFTKPIVIPTDLLMPKLKPTPQARFTVAWNKILKDLRTEDENCQRFWTVKYEASAQSIARKLIQTLSQAPEDVMADLEKLLSEPVTDKDSAKRYHEVVKFAYDQLQAVLIERRNHWRKGVILLAEALINNRERA